MTSQRPSTPRDLKRPSRDSLVFVTTLAVLAISIGGFASLATAQLTSPSFVTAPEDASFAPVVSGVSNWRVGNETPALFAPTIPDDQYVVFIDGVMRAARPAGTGGTKMFAEELLTAPLSTGWLFTLDLRSVAGWTEFHGGTIILQPMSTTTGATGPIGVSFDNGSVQLLDGSRAIDTGVMLTSGVDYRLEIDTSLMTLPEFRIWDVTTTRPTTPSATATVSLGSIDRIRITGPPTGQFDIALDAAVFVDPSTTPPTRIEEMFLTAPVFAATAINPALNSISLSVDGTPSLNLIAFATPDGLVELMIPITVMNSAPVFAAGKLKRGGFAPSSPGSGSVTPLDEVSSPDSDSFGPLPITTPQVCFQLPPSLSDSLLFLQVIAVDGMNNPLGSNPFVIHTP